MSLKQQSTFLNYSSLQRQLLSILPHFFATVLILRLRRSTYANTCHPNCRRLFCLSALQKKYSTVRRQTSTTITCGGFSTISSRQWPPCAVQITTTAGRQAQLVQNAAAWLVLAACRHDHISPLVAGHWTNYIQIGGTQLPMRPWFKPIQTAAASLWYLHAATSLIRIVHRFSHFTDCSSHHRRQSFLWCRDLSPEQPQGSSLFFSISGPVPKVTEDGTIHAILF